MNPFGSYKALLGNSMSAMLGAIEIYNKPRFDYRSECFVILLMNSWELAFKAILSRNRTRIYAEKERGKPYRTLGLFEALNKSEKLFPAEIPFAAVSANIAALVDYRNNAVHFYNEVGFETVIYGLAQTSIVNYRDLVSNIFGVDIAEEVNISLLPLSFNAPPDPIKFLGEQKHPKPAIAEFLSVISEKTRDLEEKHIDTGRFLTVFEVNMQSTKKIQSADIVVGVNGEQQEGILLVSRKVDPNKSHPHPRRAILAAIGDNLRGLKFSSYVFDALIWHNKIKDDDRLCWHAVNTNTFQYSPELIARLKSFSGKQIEEALAAYKARGK